jgi:hypothetical protein
MVPSNLPLFSNLTPSKVQAPNTYGRCPNPLPCHTPSCDCFPECSVVSFVRDSEELAATIVNVSEVAEASIFGTCADFRLTTRCHIPESAFLRSRQCSCSNTTITSRPVIFVSFIYHHPFVYATCISTTGSGNTTANVMYWLYESRSESKERFAIQRYLLIIGKKQNMQVLSHTFIYFST